MWQSSSVGGDEDDEEEEPSLWQSATRAGAGGAASAWNFAMNAISGERSGTPAKASPSTYNFAGKAPSRTWTPAAEGAMYRSSSRGAFSDENTASATDPRFATWQPARGGAEAEVEHDNPLKKMADLALQNLYEVADPESSAPTDIMNAMSIYTKAAAGTSRKKGARR